jgi:anaerobic selenocysteine-containing dehydrogenase
MDVATHFRTCPLCEAHCGVKIESEASTGTVRSVKADKLNVFSRGFVCPKSSALSELQHDSDRLRTPVRRRGADFEEVSWEEALDYTAERVLDLQARGGRDAVGVYWGTAGSQSAATIPYLGMLAQALDTKQMYTAASADNHPKTLVSALMFGCNGLYTIPDVDRTDYFLVIGGNPMVSGGSLMTAAGMPNRLREIRGRGGKIVVVDPRRTETADVADMHVAIRPGTDALLLFAMIHVLFREGRVRLGRAGNYVRDLDIVEELVEDLSPERVADATGVDPDLIRKLAREFSAAPTAVCYGRVGACTQAFGSVTTWACELLNVLTGNFDEPGGGMFAVDTVPMLIYTEKYEDGRAPYGRWRSRVRGFPEVASQFPVVALAEEIETPGYGQIRGLMTLGGNPVSSCPNGERLSRAFSSLDFMFSFDPYVNETTRHAHVIFPPPTHLEKSHFTLVFCQFMVRGYLKYSPPVFPVPSWAQDDSHTLRELTARLRKAPASTVEREYLEQMVDLMMASAPRPPSREARSAVIEELQKESGAEQFYDLFIRTGAFGDAFGGHPDGLTLAKLRDMPHGIDLGPMRRRCPEILATPDRAIHLAPEVLIQDLNRLKSELLRGRFVADAFVLIGRRQLRSHNSWLHNLPRLRKGGEACNLLMNPIDAARLGVVTGDEVTVESSAGSIVVSAEVSDEVGRAVVSLPHGWGHAGESVRLRVAAQNSGASYNSLTDDADYDVPSGNAVLTGIRVSISVSNVAELSGS